MSAIKNISFRRRLVILAAMAMAMVIAATSVAVWPSAGATHAQSGSPATASDTQVLVATLWITRHASELVALGSTATNVSMTAESLRENGVAVRAQQAGLQRQLASLAGKGYADRVGRIRVLANRLQSNSNRILAGRPTVLTVLGGNARSIAQVRRDLTPLRSAVHHSADAHFYDLTGDQITRSLQADAIRYAHISDLNSDLGAGGTFLVTALELEDPSYVGLTEEIYRSAASGIRHNLDYLIMNPGRQLDPQIVAGTNALLAVGGDQFFEDLERRFSLVAAERDLIEDNALTLRHLLFEVDGLAAAVLGTPPPTGTTPPDPLDGPPGVPGVSQTEIRFGQSAAQTGPSRELGLGMKLGITAAFEEANRSGGVRGRQLSLEALDDGYEPQRAFFNTQRLLDSGNVFGLIGSVGTPTSRATTPLARADGAPVVAPFTGAQLLREGPELANVVNYRASYHQETEHMVERLTGGLGITRVAVLYQNDSYGVDGLTGVRRALARRGLEPVAAEFYRRNSSAIRRASYQISEARPEAVIIIGTHQPAAAAIKLLRDRMETAPVFMAVSFVGSEALADQLRALGDSGAGVYVTQVTPLHDDTSSQVVRQYQAALSAVDRNADTGFVSLEGYLAGRLAIEGLKLCPTLTRECFLGAFHATRTINIDDIALRYGPGDNQGSDTVFLTVLEADGSYRLVDRLSGDSCGKVITADGQVSDTWAAGCRSQVTDRGYARYYTFTLAQQSDVTIDLMSSVDTFLYLREGEARSGAVLFFNDDVDRPAGDYGSQISETLAAGTYTIEATTYAENLTGAFTLTIRGLSGTTTAPAPETDTCGETITAADSPVTGTWAADCQSQHRSGHYSRYYTFALAQPSDVTIDLMSGVDTFLYLREGEARSGAVHLFNDDVEQNVNLNSRISASLAARTYTIEATTYSAGETGTFTLTVSGLNGE